MLSLAFSTLLAALLVQASPLPTEPGPGDVYNEGQDCNIRWDVDATSTWKTMHIELMTGPNINQVHLDTLVTIDATTETEYTYPCPAVTPNSAIYFYKFSSPQEPANILFTTRFTIAAPNGDVVPAPNRTQPGDNQPIPWGTGALNNPAAARPPPSLTPTTPSASGSSSSSGTGTGVITPSGTTTPSGITTPLPSIPAPRTTLPTTTTNSTGAPASATGAADANAIAKSSFAVLPLLALLFIH